MTATKMVQPVMILEMNARHDSLAAKPFLPDHSAEIPGLGLLCNHVGKQPRVSPFSHESPALRQVRSPTRKTRIGDMRRKELLAEQDLTPIELAAAR